MKLIYLLSCICLATGVYLPNRLQFRNLFKEPIHRIDDKLKPRIIGGQEAEPHSIPSQAFLELYTKDEGWYCGGSLISPNYVLTAAHCAVDVVEAHIDLGRHTLSQDENSVVSINSSVLFVHPEYDDESITHDLALIKLPQPVELTEAIQPIKLPTRTDVEKNLVGKIARISGWGLTDGFSSSLSTILEFVNVEVISKEECEDDFGELLDSIICTSGDEMTGSCEGDSGGPLVVDDVQVGIVSFGILWCLPGYPSAFTRVASFLDWIEENSDVTFN